MNDLTHLSARLMDLAARHETITYGALAQSLGWRVAVLTAALEALMEEDAAAHRPMRAAVMQSKLGNGLPAQGFFLKLHALGFVINDPAAFVAAQRQALISR